MKKAKLIFYSVAAIVAFGMTSCKKCAECHYDKSGAEVELGEYCDDDLEAIEANGFTDTSGTYEVHCHEH